ncbi:MAG TPA: BrnT family toxin [Desulfotomaculum sp.]|nr:BrnT family toxin [Desulfotomaculum sp.]
MGHLRISGFEWDRNNLWKPFKHGIRPEEVEEVFHNRPIRFLNTRSGRRIVLGRSDAGRYLTIVFEYKPGGIVRPITARPMKPAERKYFKRRSG